MQENARRLLRYIYESSHGDTDQIIKRKHLGKPLSLSDKETNEALKELTKAGMIQHILFRSLAMTHIGVAEASKLARGPPRVQQPPQAPVRLRKTRAWLLRVVAIGAVSRAGMAAMMASKLSWFLWEDDNVLG